MNVEALPNVYTFGDLNISSRRVHNGRKTKWAVLCEGCCKEIEFKHKTLKLWEAECNSCKMIYTITPWEYSILKPMDFQKIMGAQ